MARCAVVPASIQGDGDMDMDRITGAAKDVAGKVEGAIGEATGDAETKASGRAREAAGSAQNVFGQAKDAVRDAGDAAARFAKDTLNGDGTQAISSQVKENPIGSLLVAGGIGFALAMLMSRPTRRHSRWR